MTPFFYKPPDGWAADFIPFYWQGLYHLFYLKDFRDIAGHGEGTPWYHLVTADFVHFTDRGECLPRGGVKEQDLYVFTGSVLHGRDGRFHIFYTGHNPHLRQAGKPEQAILHAVSDDLDHWQKLPNEVFFAPTDDYEPHDWRDPFVFWNSDAGEYWMLCAARLKQSPTLLPGKDAGRPAETMTGCTALCVSSDLQHWMVKAPFYAPGRYFTHECPDLFRLGDWWYLIFSEFTDGTLTCYRMARNLIGPWQTPAIDSFDGRAFYAAKTASDGERLFLFGWNPTRENEQDERPWQWGGNLVVHELLQQPDGTLAVGIPAPVAAHFSRLLPMMTAGGLPTDEGLAETQPSQVQGEKITQIDSGHEDQDEKVILDGTEGFYRISAGMMPVTCKIELSLRYAQGTQVFGVALRSGTTGETGYTITIEPGPQRLSFGTLPLSVPMPGLERIFGTRPGEDLKMVIIIDGSICEIYANGRVALSARMYRRPGDEWGVFVAGGRMEVSNIRLKELSTASQ